MTKTKEQLEEEKKISLSIRIKPIDVDELGIYYFRVKSQFKVWISGILGIISKVQQKLFFSNLFLLNYQQSQQRLQISDF